ncbi:MAG: type IV secretory system conjugative DNA transfer family protein [Oscillospiraceae bacterium]
MNFIFSLAILVNDFTVKTYFTCFKSFLLQKVLISVCIGSCVYLVLGKHNLDNIKAKTVGDGQYGSERWLTDKEKYSVYKKVPFGEEKEPGYVIEVLKDCWVIDTSDQNIMQVAPPGAGKTTSQIIPTVIYNSLCNVNTNNRGASLLLTDCKGTLFSLCEPTLRKRGYKTPFLNFADPTKSYKYNILSNINFYMDKYKNAKTESEKLVNYGRAENYAKILSSSIVDSISSSKGDGGNGAERFFNDTAKGLLTGMSLVVSEYGDEKKNERHILSVFRLIIELNGLEEGSSDMLQKSKLEELLKYVENERIINYVGPAMKADARTSMNVFSSALANLVKFIDAELEQMICGHSEELNNFDFIENPTATFIIVPDEDNTRHFFASLYIRFLMNDLIRQSRDYKNQELPRKVLGIWDEFGQMPPINNVDMLFSAVRSRGIRFLISLQAEIQLKNKYGENMARIIKSCCQMKMYSYLGDIDEAEQVSKALGDRTVQVGSISKSTKTGEIWSDSTSQNIQMVKQRLMTANQILTMEIGNWIVTKSGNRACKTVLPYYKDYINLEPKNEEAENAFELTSIAVLSAEKIKNLALMKNKAFDKGMFDI